MIHIYRNVCVCLSLGIRNNVPFISFKRGIEFKELDGHINFWNISKWRRIGVYEKIGNYLSPVLRAPYNARVTNLWVTLLSLCVTPSRFPAYSFACSLLCSGLHSHRPSNGCRRTQCWTDDMPQPIWNLSSVSENSWMLSDSASWFLQSPHVAPEVLPKECPLSQLTSALILSWVILELPL